MKRNPLDENTSRRQVCQAMAVLVSSSVAGCPGVDLGGSDRTEVDTETALRDTSTQRSSTESLDHSPPNIGSLIGSHDNHAQANSFTLRMQLAHNKWTDGDEKNLTYRTNEEGDRAELVESLNRSDRVNQLQQLFSPGSHHVRINFADERTNTDKLSITGKPLYMSGASVLDSFLIGAALERGTVTGRSDDRQLVLEYKISDHRERDFEAGHVTTVGNNYVAELRLEWQTSTGKSAFIQLQTEDFGETTVSLPD